MKPIAGIVVGSLFVVGSAALVGNAQPEDSAVAAPVQVEARDISLILPEGTYTGLVFTATGLPGAGAASAKFYFQGDPFVVNIASGTTFCISFDGGWHVERPITIVLKPGPPVAIPGGSIPGAVGAAWAVTSEGPVALKQD